MNNFTKENLKEPINTKEKIGENVDSKILTFYLQNQKTGRSQLFTLSLSFAQISMNSPCNLYSVLGSQTGQGVEKFEVFDSENCQFLTVNQISCDHLSRTYIIKDPQFWRIVRESLSLVTIKFQPISNSNMMFFEDIKNSTPMTSMSQLITILGQSQGSTQQPQIEKDEALLNRKDKRSGQRSIQQVILLVQRWRRGNPNHTSQVKKGKKIDLKQNAREIGVSKKTLDDYYYQLRFGQKLGFNFMKNLNKKVGVLRNFIKSKIPKRKIDGEVTKLGKTLNIIYTYQSCLRQTFENQNEVIETPFLNSPQQTQISYEPLFSEGGKDVLDNGQLNFFDGYGIENSRQQNWIDFVLD